MIGLRLKTDPVLPVRQTASPRHGVVRFHLTCRCDEKSHCIGALHLDLCPGKDGLGRGHLPAGIAELDDRQCRFLACGDVDGDGKKELVASGMKSGLWLLKMSPGGKWTAALIDARSSGYEHATYLADLDGHPSPLRDELVDRLELNQRDLGRQIRDYSRGMRQKVGIIQALQGDPQLAILDEPTEGLDPLMQRAFYEILEDRQRAGRTVFFSSHVLSEVERVCDRVAIVRKGELVALTDIGELLDRRRRRVEIRLDGAVPDLAGVDGVG